MGSRGKLGFLEIVGRDKLRKMVVEDKLSQREIAEIFEVSTKTVKRAWNKLKRETKKEITYERIEEWYDKRTDRYLIPEIRKFIEYQKAKKVGWKPIVNKLKRYWLFLDKKRPSMWTIDDVQLILSRLSSINKEDNKQKLLIPRMKSIAIYDQKQAFRRFFESQSKRELLDHPLLKARRKDMRSPQGVRREKTRFTPRQFEDISNCLINDDEEFAIKLHVTLKCREGSNKNSSGLMGLKWKGVNWDDAFYGFPMTTIDVYESKTGGGTY